MTTSSQLRLLVFALCGLTLVSLVINMNVAFNVRESVKPKKISSILHQEMSQMLQNLYRTWQFQQSAKNKDYPDDLPQGHMIHQFTDTTHAASSPMLNDSLNEAPFLFHKNFTPSFILGKGRFEPVSVVIGIPSVKRADIDYLTNTLTSLFNNMYPANEDNVSIVVFLAETDQEYTTAQIKKIYENFPYEVNSGLIQVITPPVNFYPEFDVLPRTLGDPQDRVKWRSKEVLDAAYLMFVCRNKAKYYLMLEDDITALKGYISYLMEFAVEREKDEYIYLSLAKFNSIGKLFRTSTIPKWTSYLMTFYNNKPVDWLMSDYVNIVSCHPEMKPGDCQTRMNQMKPQFHVGLFQHIGKKSSYPGKTQSITDGKFAKQDPHSNPHKNPVAQVSTNFNSGDQSSAESLYNDSGGINQHFFVSESKENDHLTVRLETATEISKILLKTGRGNNDRYCENCAVTEVLSEGATTYTPCSYTSSNGFSVCRPNHVIEAFRVRNTQNIEQNVWFSMLYVQT
uniref:Alpha-1,3-mannosyl-glycoprotein 4-beta-N-acetylglucosaminyltransferase A-like n=1 Tax=Phallusia mammillata TaxID=59560 RepID=A0A6F9DLE6_9ASCI|nr:alpha-1,3-mannosyl-glycoprotein 4-beta-N-acetylglucosaminyltransferase A-like [Phallusia mammillata]